MLPSCMFAFSCQSTDPPRSATDAARGQCAALSAAVAERGDLSVELVAALTAAGMDPLGRNGEFDLELVL
jgi:hypothetical protein